MSVDNPKQSHSVHQGNILGILEELEYLVANHGCNEIITWGHVGELVYVKDKLVGLSVFLKGDE